MNRAFLTISFLWEQAGLRELKEEEVESRVVSCISTLVLWSPCAPSYLEEHTPSEMAENR